MKNTKTCILVIKTLQHLGYDKRQLRLLLSGDEEVAHALSHGEGSRVYDAAFNCESGMLNGDVVYRRKGGAIIKITVHGVSAHAGREPEKGASAIREAARKILRIEELSNPEQAVASSLTEQAAKIVLTILSMEDDF
ncbi:MAG: peptidase dimerization domain-containing protein [Clostridiales bacterium]|nr:peptidase dimerization domain-containing protein [Clostridiales bacterium]